VSEQPRVVSGPAIQYPDELRRLGQSGRVVYSVIVNSDGASDPQSIKVLRADAIQFEQAGRAYVEQARFSPGCLHGQAVRVRIALPIDFKVRR